MIALYDLVKVFWSNGIEVRNADASAFNQSQQIFLGTCVKAILNDDRFSIVLYNPDGTCRAEMHWRWDTDAAFEGKVAVLADVDAFIKTREEYLLSG